ncbi:hypothetical protein B0F90DRAFT_1387079 [Multifurca ochricompacta]|uniref:Uncharacterized protein n=1 Tax=Multifurca ochricompacta TaxID=376703 RepID=A0AAD4LX65_9AGAM|nr:hypothetical protein B0F90DRAFT_1387079 [Multifurca ochricompacta]
MPIFRPDSPYYSPLSSPACFLLASILLVFSATVVIAGMLAHLSDSVVDPIREFVRYCFGWLSDGMGKTVERTALNLSSKIDGRALMWTLECSDEDHELEQFFAGIPGFFRSTVVKNPRQAFNSSDHEKMFRTLFGLMQRTWSSNLVHESVKQRRFVIYEEAMGVAPSGVPINWDTVNLAFGNDQYGLSRSVEFGLFLKRATYDNPTTARYSKWAISKIIARSQKHDERWFELATDQLGISRRVIENYLGHGDSMFLANLIHITRNIVRFRSESGYLHWAAEATLLLVSRFNIQNTVPALQHEFCDLWNQIIREATDTEDRHGRYYLVDILRPIRHVYIGLHNGTDAAPTAFSGSTKGNDDILSKISSYPLCNIPGHRSDSTSHVEEAVAGPSREIAHTASNPSHAVVTAL